MQKTLDFLVGAQGLPDGLQADHLADLSYLDAVLADIGRVPDKGAREEDRKKRAAATPDP